ncbi:MAG TPA: S8 family peptidase [Pseudobacteroides sp.]|nr:S8 family peptidase [Pseudobacteroides sp.]
MKRRFLLVLGTIFALFVGCFLFYYYNNEEQAVNVEILKTEQIVPWGVQSINAPAQWPEITGKGVKVAVMDSGINFNHPDFGDNIKKGFNTINPSELPIDDYGHGSLVAGVIAAKDNNIGVVGVAPDVELYPVKVLDKYGEGEITDIAEGVDWCIENKMQIINMSFAIEEDKPLLRSAIMKAVHAGIVVVASAMNSNGGDVGYPASYKEVISVTAVDQRNKICSTAPRGKIDFSAPGVGIVSTASNGGYEELLGTSLAAPHITGLIALIMQDPKRFGLSESKANLNDDIYNLLKRLTLDIGEKGKDRVFGEGFVTLKNIGNIGE